VSVSVNCLGTGRTSEKEMARIAQKYYDLTPEGIIETLDLKHVDYTQTAAYGHFGKYWLPWER
jgi:S-adenosylmethionine synthetase